MTPQLAATWGEGTPVLLLHGGLISDPTGTWAAQRPLADRYQLRIALRSGYGTHPDDAFPSMDDSVAEAVALMGDGAHLVGHSSGGLIAMCVAGARPDLVKSLTIVDAPVWDAARDEESVAKLMAAMGAVYEHTTPEGFIRAFAKTLAGDDLPADFTPAPLHRRGIIATMTEPAPQAVRLPMTAVAAAALPKLVITGGWHPAFEASGARLAERIGADWQVLTGRNHGVQLLGEPFNHLLSALWSGTAGSM